MKESVFISSECLFSLFIFYIFILTESVHFEIFIHNEFFYQVEIQPAERETIFSDELRPSDPRNVGPCGGFSTQYACMCDYHGVPYRFVSAFS